MMKWNRGLWAFGAVAVGTLLIGGVARADLSDVSTERPGSIVVYPKVVWDGSRDTIIQLANTSNVPVFARCFYINAAPLVPGLPPSVANPPQWSETDFNIILTRQQPTHWVASQGRSFSGANSSFGGDNSGLPPGSIPPVPEGFIGELKCIQVDDTGAPLRSNALKGEATLIRDDGDVSEYNAIAFHGNPDMGFEEGDVNDLFLDLTPTTLSNDNGEYSACPDTLIFNHFLSGQSDSVVEALGDCDEAPASGVACGIETELTLVPCQEDLENQIPGRVTVQFQVFNEFEQAFSASTTVACFLNVPITDLGIAFTSAAVTGSLNAQTRITPNPQSGGVIGVAEEFRSGDVRVTHTASAAFNLQIEGNRFDAASNGKGTLLGGPNITDHIIIPAE